KSLEVEAPTPTRPEGLTPVEKGEVDALVIQYEELHKRRAELHTERAQLTNQLDSGELTALKFRKQLMVKIQEAAQVSDNLKETASRLIELGYRGVLR
ncbi:MAG: hypothetical protein KAW94_04915, partial [Candidatus Thorarchaeota archaeon]|nr:hypothetical protein [Candidatus Thorarchaeota archaeon]